MLFESLTENDKRFMNKYIDNFVVEGASKKRVGLDYLMRFWDEHKSDYLYRLLGNSFFAFKSIDVTKSDEELADEVELKCFGYQQPGSRFRDIFHDYIVNHYRRNNYEYCPNWNDYTSWDPNSISYLYWSLEKLIDINCLGTNVYDGPNVIVPIEGREKPFRLNHGCKVSRALGQLVDLWGLDKGIYEAFRIAHSMCLNEKHFKGDLVVSIHPIDYMTMSDNESNWQSCMNWMDSGEYRRGTVEMMNSSCVVVAYIASKNEKLSPWGYSYPDLVWNSKRWRELFIVTPAMIAGIKGYPFWNRDLEAQTIMFLRELAQTNLGWGPYNCEPTKFRNGEEFQVPEFDNKWFSFDLRTDAMYNDFYGDHYCVVTYNTPNSYFLNYSGESECLCCGQALCCEDFESEGMLYCVDCDATVGCYDCGYRDYPENMVLIDGEYYCQDCAEHYAVNCPECDELHHENSMYNIRVGIPAQYFEDGFEGGVALELSINICPDCYWRYDHNGKIHHYENNDGQRWWGNHWEYIMLDDLSKELKYALSLHDLEHIKSTLKYLYRRDIKPWSKNTYDKPQTEIDPEPAESEELPF